MEALEENVSKNSGKGNKKVIIGVVIVLLLCAIGIGAYFLFSSKTMEYAKKIETLLNKSLSDMHADLVDTMSYDNFTCSGGKVIECKSKNISFKDIFKSSDKDVFKSSDIIITFSGLTDKVKINVQSNMTSDVAKISNINFKNSLGNGVKLNAVIDMEMNNENQEAIFDIKSTAKGKNITSSNDIRYRLNSDLFSSGNFLTLLDKFSQDNFSVTDFDYELTYEKYFDKLDVKDTFFTVYGVDVKNVKSESKINDKDYKVDFSFEVAGSKALFGELGNNNNVKCSIFGKLEDKTKILDFNLDCNGNLFEKFDFKKKMDMAFKDIKIKKNNKTSSLNSVFDITNLKDIGSFAIRNLEVEMSSDNFYKNFVSLLEGIVKKEDIDNGIQNALKDIDRQIERYNVEGNTELKNLFVDIKNVVENIYSGKHNSFTYTLKFEDGFYYNEDDDFEELLNSGKFINTITSK